MKIPLTGHSKSGRYALLCLRADIRSLPSDAPGQTLNEAVYLWFQFRSLGRNIYSIMPIGHQGLDSDNESGENGNRALGK